VSAQAGASQQPAAPASLHAAAAADACPLCGAGLAPDQEWCLRCGAAARTRLAAAPNWRAPLAVLAVVAAIALAVLAIALVKLAGDSGPAPAAITRTVTAPAAATPAPTTPGATTTPGTTITPGATTTPGATATPGTSTTTPGAATTGTDTTGPTHGLLRSLTTK
jgi:hypothetical protein